MITRIPGKALMMRSVASRPLRPGMEMSMKTTSGWADLANSRAWRPSLASPAISTPGISLSASRMPARTMVLSSATMTRISLGESCFIS